MPQSTSMTRLHPNSIVTALKYLTKQDKKIKCYVSRNIALTYRKRKFCFETFINVVVNQQLSDKASDTIRRRIYSLLDNQVTATSFLETEVADLRKCGISNQKIQHLRSIATVVQSDPKYFSRLRRQDVEDCRQELLALKGIGPWSASIISLFYIGHPDVLVEGDVTINKVLARLYGVEIGDVSARIHDLTEHWRPYRSVGCMLCWHLYDNDMI
jgi:DNA-3-methyladenine glycosylase II